MGSTAPDIWRQPPLPPVPPGGYRRPARPRATKLPAQLPVSHDPAPRSSGGGWWLVLALLLFALLRS